MNIILFGNEEREFKSDDERYLHLKKVLKAGVGSVFKGGVINGAMGECKITSFDQKLVTFDFSPLKDGSVLYPVTMLLSEVRPICMRRILREVVSLGVGKIVLVISDLGEKSYAEASLYTQGLYKSILLDGAMQSGFTGVPEVLFAKSVEDAITMLPPSGPRLLLDPHKAEERLSEQDLTNLSPTIAIGPERGWSAREIKVFLDNEFKPLLLGNRILRTETAAVSALTLTLARMNLI